MGRDSLNLEEILQGETEALAELVEVNRALASLPEFDQEAVDRALERRAAIIGQLDALERQADEVRPQVALTPVQLHKVRDLKALAALAQREEAAALERMRSLLESHKAETLALDRSKTGLTRYQGAVSHLSRFTDRIG